MKRIHLIVVEPHADDAYLSLHAHMLRWKKRGVSITIVTVQSAVDNRANEAKAYAEAIGVTWYGMGFGYGQLPTADDFDFSSIPEYIPEGERGFSLIITPLGIQHPDHIQINKLLQGTAHLNYFDVPYYTKQKNQEDVNQSNDRNLHSVRVPHGSKRQFARLFKSQSRYFYYNRPADLARIPEICLVAPANSVILEDERPARSDSDHNQSHDPTALVLDPGL